jgi:protease I
MFAWSNSLAIPNILKQESLRNEKRGKGSEPMKKNILKKRVLFVIAQNDFRDEELFVPKRIIEKAGIEVVVSSITTDMCHGKLGGNVLPDIAVKDVDMDDYDMIIMAGGPGAPTLADYEEVRAIFVQARTDKKPFGAICIAPVNLAKFGVLEDKKATVFETEETVEALEEAGAHYTGQDIEIDGNIITANGPDAAEAFGRAIVKLLCGRP